MHLVVDLNQPTDWLNVTIQLAGILMNAASLLVVGVLAYRSANSATEMTGLLRKLETASENRALLRDAVAKALVSTANPTQIKRDEFSEAKSTLNILLDPTAQHELAVLNHLDQMPTATDLKRWRNELASLTRSVLRG